MFRTHAKKEFMHQVYTSRRLKVLRSSFFHAVAFSARPVEWAAVHWWGGAAGAVQRWWCGGGGPVDITPATCQLNYTDRAALFYVVRCETFCVICQNYMKMNSITIKLFAEVSLIISSSAEVFFSVFSKDFKMLICLTCNLINLSTDLTIDMSSKHYDRTRSCGAVRY